MIAGKVAYAFRDQHKLGWDGDGGAVEPCVAGDMLTLSERHRGEAARGC
jgi:hypothetical protein